MPISTRRLPLLPGLLLALAALPGMAAEAPVPMTKLAPPPPAPVVKSAPAPAPVLAAQQGMLTLWHPVNDPKASGFTVEHLPEGMALDATNGYLVGKPEVPGTSRLVLRWQTPQGPKSLTATVQIAAPVNPPTPTPVAKPEAPSPAEADAPKPEAPVTPPPVAAPALATQHADAAKSEAKKEEEEEDVADPSLALGVTLYPHTEYQRRSIYSCFLPTATPLKAGDWYYRISHVTTVPINKDIRTDFLGLDSGVNIGFMVGYGIYDDMDLTLQRVTGEGLNDGTVDTIGGGNRFDYWELLWKWKFLDQYDRAKDQGGLADVALVVGATEMVRNTGGGDVSVNVAVIAERNMFQDRLRLGVGLARAGLSTHYYDQPGPGDVRRDKLLPSEYDYQAQTPGWADTHERPAKSTTAIPITAKIAVTETIQILGEAIYPINGYHSDYGPSLAVGARLNTNTHEFTLFLANTANTTFNSVITGGNTERTLTTWPNLFGFTISAFF